MNTANMNTKITSLVAVILAASATCLPAQSSREREREREREIERRAERLSRNIERTVEASIEGAIRSVEQAFEHLDKRQGTGGRQGATRIDTTFAFSADGTVDLTSFNGDIIVTAGVQALHPGQQVRLLGTSPRTNP